MVVVSGLQRPPILYVSENARSIHFGLYVLLFEGVCTSQEASNRAQMGASSTSRKMVFEIENEVAKPTLEPSWLKDS